MVFTKIYDFNKFEYCDKKIKKFLTRKGEFENLVHAYETPMQLNGRASDL